MPTAPARRWRPAEPQTPPAILNGRHSQREAPFFRSRHRPEQPAIPITSPHNQKLKEIRKLSQRRHERDRTSRFVAEGEDLLAAADAEGWVPVERFCAHGSGLPGIEVEPKLLSAAAGLASGTRTLALYEERWAPAPRGPLAVYLHGLSDPGNVGAVLRSAHAFGAASVAIGPGTADPFSPHAVRASMGAIFAVPVARCGSIGALPGITIALDPNAAAGSLADTLAIIAAERRSPEVTLIIGAERAGLPDQLLCVADHVARIPIATHSLNAAMAATVALYEARRTLGEAIRMATS